MPRSPFRWDNHKYRIAGADGAEAMKKRTWIGLAAVVVVLVAAVFFGYRKWGVQSGSAREEALELMPTDASAILFADFSELRQAPFVAKLYVYLDAKKRPEEVSQWRARFERLAGSPVFAVIRQDAAVGAALAAQAPGGLRSPQLSTLLDQLQWITLAGKPENDRLRVVAEGECAAEATARQLVDVMNGVVILAQGGLNDAKTRQRLDPAMREAYLELLKSADVSKIDRGDTKSVRLVFEITPAFLEAARKAPPVMPDSAPGKPLPGKAPAPRKGHT